MSERNPWFDGPDDPEPPAARQVRPPRRRPRPLVLLGIVLAVLLVSSSAFARLWSERLWFDSVGYSSVFSTVLWTRVGLFLVFGAVMALVVGGSMVVAYRLRPLMRHPDGSPLDRYRDVVLPMRWPLLIGTALVLAAFSGASASGQWRHYLLWRNAEPFGAKDPFFDKDVGFYVFTLPWLHFVVDFLIAATLIALLAAAFVHYVFGGINLTSRGQKVSRGATAQLSSAARALRARQGGGLLARPLRHAHQLGVAGRRGDVRRPQRRHPGPEHPDLDRGHLPRCCSSPTSGGVRGDCPSSASR